VSHVTEARGCNIRNQLYGLTNIGREVQNFKKENIFSIMKPVYYPSKLAELALYQYLVSVNCHLDWKIQNMEFVIALQ
jgi:hypothetical protein